MTTRTHYTTRTEAIQHEIITAIESDGSTKAAEYDIDTIASITIAQDEQGYYCCVTADEFWLIVSENLICHIPIREARRDARKARDMYLSGAATFIADTASQQIRAGYELKPANAGTASSLYITYVPRPDGDVYLAHCSVCERANRDSTEYDHWAGDIMSALAWILRHGLEHFPPTESTEPLIPTGTPTQDEYDAAMASPAVQA